MPGVDKLDDLTGSMLWAKRQRAPKLKATAAECRGLIPIAAHLAETLLTDPDSTGLAVKQATRELHACYQCLAPGPCSGSLADHSRRFCSIWVAVADKQPDIFRVKPKMHLFQELCEMSGDT